MKTRLAAWSLAALLLALPAVAVAGDPPAAAPPAEPPAHDPAHPPIDCPLRKAQGIDPPP